MNAHDTIESELVDVIPSEGIDDAQGITLTQCALASRIENALVKGGHLAPDPEPGEPWDDARIREAFIYDGGEAEYHDPIHGRQTQRKAAGETFDRWLKARDARLREEIASEIHAEREDTPDGIGYDSYINGLLKAEDIARNGRS